MANLGAYQAVMVDGGGSSTAVANTTVITHPTDTDLWRFTIERPVTVVACVKTDDAVADAGRTIMRDAAAQKALRNGQKVLHRLKVAAASSPPPPPRPPCPPKLAAEAAQTGRISVKSLGAVGNRSAAEDTAAIELAVAMVHSCRASIIWFPPSEGYWLNKTIVIPDYAGDLVFRGKNQSKSCYLSLRAYRTELSVLVRTCHFFS
eukprot:SAG31_NODE_15951_length_730_cov_0.789223_1_plen_205_part_10